MASKIVREEKGIKTTEDYETCKGRWTTWKLSLFNDFLVARQEHLWQKFLFLRVSRRAQVQNFLDEFLGEEQNPLRRVSPKKIDSVVTKKLFPLQHTTTSLLAENLGGLSRSLGLLKFLIRWWPRKKLKIDKKIDSFTSWRLTLACYFFNNFLQVTQQYLNL